jgi:hypothetical protein
VLARLRASEAVRVATAEAARARVLAAHTASHRAAELERHLEEARRRRQGTTTAFMNPSGRSRVAAKAASSLSSG